MNRTLRTAFVTCVLALCTLSSSAQMTRGQMLRKFYQITTLHNSGRDADAVAVCEEIIAAYPSYPDTYLRLAEIYDSANEGEMALAMYRTYVSLEMDDDKVAECSPRLKELETKFGMSHIADIETEILRKSEKTAVSERKAEERSVPERETNITPFESAPSEDVNFESLFDISALVSTASDDDEYLSELSKEDTPVSIEQLSATSAKLISDAYLAETPIPDETVKAIDAMFSTAPSVHSEVGADLCSEPFRFVSRKGLVSGLQINATGKGPEQQQQFKSAESLCGRWSSSLFSEDDGLEFLICDIKEVGNEIFMSFDSECGLFREHKNNILKTSWNRIKSIWTTDGAKFDARSLTEGLNRIKYSPDRLNVTCQLPVRNRPNVATMGKNLLDNLAAAIPYGNVVSRFGGSLINYVNKNHTNSSFQTIIDIEIRCLTNDVLVCDFIVHENQNNSGLIKDVLVENKSFFLYRVTGDYSAFTMKESGRNAPLVRAMYRKLESESEHKSQLMFPLAIMSYCKAGVGENTVDVLALSKSVNWMQKLSDEGCLRASAWLVPVYYNLSMDEEHYPLRLQRKHFRDQEEKLLDDMIKAEIPVAYGLKGDILAGGYSDSDKALAIYDEGVKKGDAHSLYRMGVIFSEGQLVTRDYAKSQEYLRRAMDMGYADAYLQTALSYRYGQGVDKNYARYVEYLNKAVEAGSQDAILELSEALMIGLGVERDVSKAIEARRLYFTSKNDIWRDVLGIYGYSLNE